MKALIISLLLSLTIPGTRTEMGIVFNQETIQTADGQLWNVTTEIEPGSFVIVEFNTKGTETIYDDEIIFPVRGVE